RLQLEEAIKVSQRLGQAAELELLAAAQVVGRGRLRVQCDCFAEVDDRLSVLSQQLVGAAEPEPGAGVLRLLLHLLFGKAQRSLAYLGRLVEVVPQERLMTGRQQALGIIRGE